MTSLSPFASRVSSRLLAFALLSPLVASAIESNGRGGGHWRATSSWAENTVPAGEHWVVRAGDTIRMEKGDVYLSERALNDVLGHLVIGAGASVRMWRLNSRPGAVGGTIHVTGGELNMGRWIGHATLRVDAGLFVCRDEVATLHDGLIEIRGGEVRFGGPLHTPTRLHGGRLVFSRGTKDLQGLTTPARGGFWRGGTVVINTSSLAAGGGDRLLDALGSDAGNVLALSDKPVRQTLSLGGRLVLERGHLRIKVYSHLQDDADRLELAGGAPSFGPSVQITVEGAELPGAPGDYLGRSYRLFSGASSFAGIQPSLDPTVWRIADAHYRVHWSDTLGQDGRLTVEKLTRVEAF